MIDKEFEELKSEMIKKVNICEDLAELCQLCIDFWNATYISMPKEIKESMDELKEKSYKFGLDAYKDFQQMMNDGYIIKDD